MLARVGKGFRPRHAAALLLLLSGCNSTDPAVGKSDGVVTGNTATGASNGSGGSSGAFVAGGSAGTAGAAGGTTMTCAPPGALSTCGNGVVDPGEWCDGAALRGLLCSAVDPFFTGGTLSCSNACTLVTTQCTHDTCRNGVIDPGEDCEYAHFNQTLCNSLLPGSDGALVECSASTCRYDFSNCAGMPEAKSSKWGRRKFT